MFESISRPVLPRRQFLSRMTRAMLLGAAMIAISFAPGEADYLYFFPKLDWADAFVNAPMILWGMVPMAVPESTGAKLFSGCYAIFSGLMLVMSAGVVIAPVAHRFPHKPHADEDDNRESAKHDPTKKH